MNFIVDINNRAKSRINTALIKRTATNFLRQYGQDGQEVSIALVGDTVMKRLNKQYRQKDGPTDVLSFGGEGDFFGEIIIDYQEIKRQARENNTSPGKELIFILVHGLLHLAGYNDNTELKRRKMIERGEEFLRKTGSRK